MRELEEREFEGVRIFLTRFNPALLPSLQRLVIVRTVPQPNVQENRPQRKRPFISPARFGKADKEAILSTLHRVKKSAEGSALQFNGQSIDELIAVWARLAAPI
jgi:hypothetical protein